MAVKKAKPKAKVKTSGKAVTKKPAMSTKPKAVSKTPAAKAPSKARKKKTTFRLEAPSATQVFVAGCFNDWDPAANPLKWDKGGVWTCTLVLEPGEYEYRLWSMMSAGMIL